MLAREIADDVPTVSLDTLVDEAARLLAAERLPGLILVGDDGRPAAVLSSTDLLRLLVPLYAVESQSAAKVLDERGADMALVGAGKRRLRECLPGKPRDLPVVSGGATLLEVAVLMVRNQCLLVAVVDTASGLSGALTLQAMLDWMYR